MRDSHWQLYTEQWYPSWLIHLTTIDIAVVSPKLMMIRMQLSSQMILIRIVFMHMLRQIRKHLTQFWNYLKLVKHYTTLTLDGLVWLRSSPLNLMIKVYCDSLSHRLPQKRISRLRQRIYALQVIQILAGYLPRYPSIIPPAEPYQKRRLRRLHLQLTCLPFNKNSSAFITSSITCHLLPCFDYLSLASCLRDF